MIEMLRYIVKKCSLLLLIAFFLERSYEIIGKYLKQPTYFDTHFVPQYHASFPALTVCSLNGYKLDVLQVRCYLILFNFKLFVFYINLYEMFKL